MFNGPNSQGSANTPKNYQTQPTEDWSLNPAFYQNIAGNELVDWAAIAAKWIQMKESYPQNISTQATMANSGPAKELLDEKGEAPMEVEKEEDIPSAEPVTVNFASTGQPQQVWAANWNAPQTTPWRNPAWDHNWVTEPTTSVAPSQPIQGTVSLATTTKSYKTVQEPIKIPGLMDEEIKLEASDDEESNSTTLDSNKRKLLPAWIREGLEKMEREKQRNERNEKEMKERQKLMEERRRLEEEAIRELQKSNQSFVPKSKFDDSDDDGEEEEKIEPSPPSPPSMAKVVRRSREELVEELMLSVRKNLTEILLEVTNEEIATIAKETLSKVRRKAPTAQTLRKTPALSSLTGGLGLGIYADSSDSASDDDDADSNKNEDEDGTDTETELALQESVRRKKREFEVTAREIEAQIEEQEAEEDRKNREDVRERGGSKNVFQKEGEIQPIDKIYSIPKHHSGRNKSRFSDLNDTVRSTHITHVAIMPEQAGQPISIVPIANPASSALPVAGHGSDSSESRSSSRHKKKKSKKHKKHKRRSDDEDSDDDRSKARWRDKGHRRTRSRSRSRSSSRSSSRRDRDERSRRDRKYSSSSSSYRSKHRSRSRSRSRSHRHHR